MRAYYLKPMDEKGEHLMMEPDEIPDEFSSSYNELVKEVSIPYEEVYFEWKERNNI